MFAMTVYVHLHLLSLINFSKASYSLNTIDITLLLAAERTVPHSMTGTYWHFLCCKLS